MRAHLSSGDLARATGNTVRTIRFYEEEGLLTPAVVSEGGHRRYTEDDLERLQLITDLRELGLALCEIRSMLDLRSGCYSAAEFALRFQEVLAGHLEQAQRRLERLKRLKEELLQGLAAIQVRLSSSGTEQCPCAVAEAANAPRIVKVLARQQGCCGHHHGEHHAHAGDAQPRIAGGAASTEPSDVGSGPAAATASGRKPPSA
ncbi:MerR family transcriptional regulator [Anaeromyxobacter oryzisoli]|uniref:MerR family transcriptional regulator n=1 Tax=Anaeromyxobacter oryzisoli TaxID=2925408 RepID=UPI001F571BFA|nr:MerR family transcriptional regulator [Anaeromyxobacter sp. SG63]